jgi:hypothetical protein
MKPTELAASRVLGLFIIYPIANNKSSISRKNSVNHSTQELRMAAMVNMTVKINQAQQYMPSALLKSGDSWPVVESV